MRTALVLSMHNLGSWSARAATAPRPGGSLPYGLQHLRQHLDLTWSDAQQSGIWRTRIPRAVGGAIRRGAPGLQGSLGACYAIRRQRSAEVVLSIFENAGLGFARVQRLRAAGRPRPHVMLACWLAEDCQHMSSGQLRSTRRSIRSISTLAVFSVNQVQILRHFLGIPAERIQVIPFGVDTDYYHPAAVPKPAGGGGIVAVGGDSRRDYATLGEAARIARLPLTLVCYPRNIAGIDLPSQVRVLPGISHDQYRRLVHSADLVVTPTIAPAYPSGQSVLLEAMSMGRATLTTDSPAIRDYVTDGVSGLLTPPGEPAAMAEMMHALLADAGLRKSMGDAAATAVRECFGLDHMWRSVAGLLTEAGQPAMPQSAMIR